MHDIDRTLAEQLEPEADAFEVEDPELEADQLEGGGDLETYQDENGAQVDAGAEMESPFGEGEEMELATELIGVSDEAELEQFLGSVLKRAWRRARTFAPVLRVVAPQLGGILKGVAKQLLPAAAGAAGTFLGGPVGATLGSKLGSLASNALESELGGMSPDDQEFETARRVVRLAGAAASQAAAAQPGADPTAIAKNAVVAAMRQQFPGVGAVGAPASRHGHHRSGRWVRRGNKIILFGV